MTLGDDLRCQSHRLGRFRVKFCADSNTCLAFKVVENGLRKLLIECRVDDHFGRVPAATDHRKKGNHPS